MPLLVDTLCAFLEELGVDLDIDTEEDRAPSVELEGYRWILPNRARAFGDRMVAVDVLDLDPWWQRDRDGYIGPDDEGMRGRRQGFADFLTWTRNPIETPEVCWGPYARAVQFLNGRHRYSVLRDRGVRRVAVAVPRENIDLFLKMVGGEVVE